MKYRTSPFLTTIASGILLLCIAISAGCKAAPAPAVSVDYTDKDSVSRELHTIEQLIDKNPLPALVRAKRLIDRSDKTDEKERLFLRAQEAVTELFMQAAETEQWQDALRLLRSLEAVGTPPENWSEQTVSQKLQESWYTKKYHALTENLLPQHRENTLASIERVRAMIPGVVTVWVDRGITIEKGMGRADRMIGSGFFIDKNGYLITNYHVIQSDVDPEYEGYSRVYIKRSENASARIPAKVIGWDPVFDLALLKVEIEPPVYFRLGSSKDLNIGSRIYAIGSPAGLDSTLTSGIVSAQNRRLLSLGKVLQIDAPINHGSSGGPIIDEAGRVQAVVFAGLERQEGLNFAIPVELLQLVLPALYSGGKTVHAWLGIYGGDAESDIQTVPAGAEVIYTLPNGPASHIPHGSIITAVNGVPVRNLETMQDELLKYESNTIIALSGYEPADTTSGEEKSKQFIPRTWYALLEARPEYPAEQVYRREIPMRAVLPLYGMYLESAGGKKSFRIAQVLPGSYADEAGFTAGDYFEIRGMELHKEDHAVYTRIYTKRRKTGYLDAFMGIWAYLDSPAYF